MRFLRIPLLLAISVYGCSDEAASSAVNTDALTVDDTTTPLADVDDHTDDEDGHIDDEDGHTEDEDGHPHDPDATDEEHLHIDTEWAEAVKAGQNRLKIHLRDHDDAPVVGATIDVDPQMPIHGHGSTEEPVITEVGEGNYEAFPVTFTMPGPWVVTVTATAKDEAGESVERTTKLDVDVPGAM